MVVLNIEAAELGGCLSDDDLAGFVAGDLAPEEARRLAAHLDRCSDCRRLVSAYARAAGAPAVDAPLAAGQVLGRFTLVRPLGQGAMGEVWAAHDSELGRGVALKLLHLRAASLGSSAASRLRREAQAMARLDHPNVVVIYELGAAAGRVFCAMRLIEGVTLRTWLATPRRWRDVLAVLIAAGRGLAAAHAAGLVHRDVKPENILIASDGRALVTDFGLAKLAESHGDESADPVEQRGAHGPGRAAQGHARTGADTASTQRDTEVTIEVAIEVTTDATFDAPRGQAPTLAGPESLTRTGALIGTPAYMAPEQLAGEAVDATSDQFALCVTLYEALYGVRPFQVQAVDELAAAVRSGPRRPPNTHGVPGRILRALRRGLSVDRAARWPSLAALLDELERALRQRRQRIVVTAIAAAIAIAALAAAGLRTDPAELVRRASETRIAEAWNPARAARLRVAFYGSGSPLAGERVASVIRAFDSYRGDWVRARFDAWAATHLRREQTSELLERRLACFDRLADAFGELAALLSSATAADLTRAPQAAYKLDPVTSCAQVAQLTVVSPPPSTPAGIEAEHGLGELQALMRLGRQDQVVQRATTLVEQAQRAHDPVLLARARFNLGAVQADVGKPTDAEATLRQAIQDAADARDHYLVAAAWLLLHGVLANKLERPDAAAAIEPAVAAAVAQAGNDPRQLADLASARGIAALVVFHAIRARDFFLQARERYAATNGIEHPSVAETDVNLGAVLVEIGELDAASQALGRARASIQRSMGEHHPLVARVEANLSELATKRNDWADAARHDRAAIAIFELVYGPDQRETARRRIFLARDLRELRRFAEARAELDHARDSLHRTLPPAHPEVVSMGLRYAQQAEAEGNVADAERLARTALNELRATHASDTRITYVLGELARIVSHRSPREALPIYDEALGFDVRRESRNDRDDAEELEELARVALAAEDPAFALRWIDRYPGAAPRLTALRAELEKARDQRPARP